MATSEAERTSSLVTQLAERLGASARAATVYGTPVERDGVTVIPVARARWGFGGGGGSGPQQASGGAGGGGGMMIEPVGYIELRGGESRFRPVRDPLASLPPALLGALIVILLFRGLGRSGRR